MPVEPLALLLLRASRWFDAQLLDRLEARGWPRLTPAQSLVFAHLSPGPVPPAALARRLGTTRQATQDLVAGLVRLGVLTQADDPARRGGRLVVLTPSGRDLARDARRVLAELERELGDARVAALRELLDGLGGTAGRRAGVVEQSQPTRVASSGSSRR